jgi:hypothetical protein
VDVHISTYDELASQLRLSVSPLNTVVNNHEEIEGSYAQCGPFSKQQKLLKCLPLEKLEFALAAWFKQARESNASTGGTHLKEKTFNIASYLGIANFLDWNGWINRCERRHNIV